MSEQDLPLGWFYARHGVIWHITNDDSSAHYVKALCGKHFQRTNWTSGAWAVRKRCRRCAEAYQQARAREMAGGPAA